MNKTRDLLTLRFNHVGQLNYELYCKLRVMRDNLDHSVTAPYVASEDEAYDLNLLKA